MEWATLQHLDLRHAGRSSKPLQPHAAAFHPTQALVAAAVGNHIIGNLFYFTVLFIAHVSALHQRGHKSAIISATESPLREKITKEILSFRDEIINLSKSRVDLPYDTILLG